MTIAPPCSAALPTIATTTTAMKNSPSPTAVAKAWSEWTRISLTQAVAAVAIASAASAAGIVHASSCGSRVRCRAAGGGGGSVRRRRRRRAAARSRPAPTRRPRRAAPGPRVADRRGITNAATAAPRGRAARAASGGRSPPSGPAICVTPNTSRRFETTLPASEPRTTTGRFAPIAKSATISSGAFPKLALRKPPMPGPVCSAACSVASPISHASGMSESAASTKSVTSPAPVSLSIAT